MWNLIHRDLSYIPLIGVGQEMGDNGVLVTSRERSFLIEPIAGMAEQVFFNHVQEILFNPTGEPGNGPFDHTQYCALVKLSSHPQAFLLSHVGTAPTGPQDYAQRDDQGNSATARLLKQHYYTQLEFGARATPAMIDATDQPDDIGNPRPGTGKQGAGQPGKRFVIQDMAP
jgi:hypothetical protein